jgi:hypothetical protein
MRLAVVVLVVAIVSAVLGRVARRFGVTPAPPPAYEGHVRVLLVAPVRDAAWRDALWHMVAQAAAPSNVRFGVLLECTHESDLGDDVDTELRACARVVHVPRRAHHGPAQRLRRVARRFVQGDEAALVCVDYRARLTHGWDAVVVALLRDRPRRRLTAPAAGHAFPTLTADGKRGVSRAFQTPPSLTSTPAVCWCAECTAAATADALLDTSAPLRVPCTPLLEEDEGLEVESASGSVSVSGSGSVSREERVGLSPSSSDAERIRKFGSSRAARLAIEFV